MEPWGPKSRMGNMSTPKLFFFSQHIFLTTFWDRSLDSFLIKHRHQKRSNTNTRLELRSGCILADCDVTSGVVFVTFWPLTAEKGERANK